jgi:glycosyltransferase involved in cell wall biosynthesis
MKNQFQKGVSVIICCYNSAARISKTLRALADQEVDPSLAWEIILVDNASTDLTSAIAASAWKSFRTDTDLRILPESAQGLTHARKRGIQEARYGYLIFCDDDNWLSETYVREVYNILDKNPRIAACGGMGIPVFEGRKPYWFEEYREAFALGSQDISRENGRILHLYGAGLGINRAIIEELEKASFQPFLQGRTGNRLSSSEDTELTYAMVLRGHELYYSKQLKFHHYLPKERLTMDYLRKLFIAFGKDGPIRNLYYSQISKRFFHKRIQNWNFHMLLSIVRLFKYGIVPPKKYGWRIYFDWNLAYIRQLLALRPSYSKIKHKILKIKEPV